MVTPYVQVFENKIRKHFVWKIPIKEKEKSLPWGDYREKLHN